MLEAFERHLKQHNIAKQFEEAKTKEEKIEVCRKFLESEGLSVRPNLDPELQLKEARKNNTIQNTLVLGGGGAGGVGNLTIDSSVMSGKLLSTWQPSTPNNPVSYLQSTYRICETDTMLLKEDNTDLKGYALFNLTEKLRKGIEEYICNRNLIHEETDYATGDKIYRVKIGIVG